MALFARVPLASGLLSGTYSRDTTFSGVGFETGLAAVADLEEALPEGVSLPAATLAGIAAQRGITSVVPGARIVRQAESNADAGALADLDLTEFDAAVHRVYDERLREAVHPQW